MDRQMYLTGGIGSSGLYERFTIAYDLPNERNYAESCASIGLAMFCSRMAQITHEEQYVSTMETALYNTITAATALNGERFFYVNPLEVWPDNCLPYTSMAHVKPVRQKWFGCACCPPNLARTYASIGSYIFHTDNERVWINLHAGAEIDVEIEGHKVHILMRTEMPYDGVTTITVSNPEAAEGAVMLRVPGYAENPVITFADGEADPESGAHTDGETSGPENGMPADGRIVKPESGAFAEIPLEKGEFTFTIRFDMPAHFVYADPGVRADAGKVAVCRGQNLLTENATEDFTHGKDLKRSPQSCGLYRIVSGGTENQGR